MWEPEGYLFSWQAALSFSLNSPPRRPAMSALPASHETPQLELVAAPAVAPVDGQIDLEPTPLAARFYGRRPARGAAPLVLHLHGGQFVAGGLDSGRCMATLLAQAGAVVVSVAYPLAPQHPFPKGLEAAYAALAWVHKKRARLAGAGAPLYVAGEEAGGNLAAALALMARDQLKPELAGQILVSPMLDACLATASVRGARAGAVGCQFADGWHHYLARPCDADHPYAAPGSSRRLAGLPPTLLLTAQDDILRDEACGFARRLSEAGVTVESAVLGQATGWPCTLQEPSGPMPWADTVREQLRSFLSRPAAAGA